MGDVRDRMRQVLQARGWEPNDWARAANLPSVSNVANILRSAAKDPRPAHKTIAALAKAANVSVLWLGEGEGSSGLSSPTDGPHVEREPQPAYSEGEAPLNFNLPNWDALAAAALALEEARAVPECFIEIVGYDNGLLTGPLRPADVLKLARLTAEYRTAGEVEAMLVALRAKHGRPPLRRGADPGPTKLHAPRPSAAKASGGEG